MDSNGDSAIQGFYEDPLKVKFLETHCSPVLKQIEDFGNLTLLHTCIPKNSHADNLYVLERSKSSRILEENQSEEWNRTRISAAICQLGSLLDSVRVSVWPVDDFRGIAASHGRSPDDDDFETENVGFQNRTNSETGRILKEWTCSVDLNKTLSVALRSRLVPDRGSETPGAIEVRLGVDRGRPPEPLVFLGNGATGEPGISGTGAEPVKVSGSGSPQEIVSVLTNEAKPVEISGNTPEETLKVLGSVPAEPVRRPKSMDISTPCLVSEGIFVNGLESFRIPPSDPSVEDCPLKKRKEGTSLSGWKGKSLVNDKKNSGKTQNSENSELIDLTDLQSRNEVELMDDSVVFLSPANAMLAKPLGLSTFRFGKVVQESSSNSRSVCEGGNDSKAGPSCLANSVPKTQFPIKSDQITGAKVIYVPSFNELNGVLDLTSDLYFEFDLDTLDPLAIEPLTMELMQLSNLKLLPKRLFLHTTRRGVFQQVLDLFRQTLSRTTDDTTIHGVLDFCRDGNAATTQPQQDMGRVFKLGPVTVTIKSGNPIDEICSILVLDVSTLGKNGIPSPEVFEAYMYSSGRRPSSSKRIVGGGNIKDIEPGSLWHVYDPPDSLICGHVILLNSHDSNSLTVECLKKVFRDNPYSKLVMYVEFADSIPKDTLQLQLLLGLSSAPSGSHVVLIVNDAQFRARLEGVLGEQHRFPLVDVEGASGAKNGAVEKLEEIEENFGNAVVTFTPQLKGSSLVYVAALENDAETVQDFTERVAAPWVPDVDEFMLLLPMQCPIFVMNSELQSIADRYSVQLQYLARESEIRWNGLARDAQVITDKLSNLAKQATCSLTKKDFYLKTPGNRNGGGGNNEDCCTPAGPFLTAIYGYMHERGLNMLRFTGRDRTYAPVTLTLESDRATLFNSAGDVVESCEVTEEGPGGGKGGFRDSGLGIVLPPNWTSDPNSGGSELVALDAGSQEYQDVVNLLTSPAGKVGKVERVENPLLYRKFTLQRRQVEHELKTETNVVQSLFHGTNPQKAKSILLRGFDRGYAGHANGRAYGAGTYFTPELSYALRFTHDALLIVDVITGKWCQGAPNMSVLPDGCHCAVDAMNRPMMFIVFHDDHAYPKYLVTFDNRPTQPGMGANNNVPPVPAPKRPKKPPRKSILKKASVATGNAPGSGTVPGPVTGPPTGPATGPPLTGPAAGPAHQPPLPTWAHNPTTSAPAFGQGPPGTLGLIGHPFYGGPHPQFLGGPGIQVAVGPPTLPHPAYPSRMPVPVPGPHFLSSVAHGPGASGMTSSVNNNSAQNWSAQPLSAPMPSPANGPPVSTSQLIQAPQKSSRGGRRAAKSKKANQ